MILKGKFQRPAIPVLLLPFQLTRLKRQESLRLGEASIRGEKSLGHEAKRLAPVSRVRVNGPLQRDNHGALRHVVLAYPRILNAKDRVTRLLHTAITMD